MLEAGVGDLRLMQIEGFKPGQPPHVSQASVRNKRRNHDQNPQVGMAFQVDQPGVGRSMKRDGRARRWIRELSSIRLDAAGRCVLRGQPNPSSGDQRTEAVTVDLRGGQAAEVTVIAK